MNIGTVLHHFQVTNVRALPELEASLWELRHDPTGARLVWLDRKDENKTFAIAFQTIPEDSTGVFHILEHSVLCGSDKYPVKEPFVELIKSSVQTFLNAMTYPDKTVYPVSSRSDQDLLNLISVYMDAVLHPAIYHKPEIFRQEGWRYVLQEDAAPIYQGVVFNEMKGAYAEADTVLEYEMNKLLFPDTCYRHESGGHPDHIPDLTYEQFLASHRKYYHPSNACIALSGSVDLDAVLGLIDSYLTGYDRQETQFSIPLQAPVAYLEQEAAYEIGADEEPAAKTIVSCGQVFGTYADVEAVYTAAVLADYLAGDNEAPLKRAILDAGLGQDVRVTLHDSLQQPWISWAVWNTDKEQLPQIKETVSNTLTALCSGLDRSRLEACFNRFAFQVRDRDGGSYPRGLGEVLNMVEPMIYGGDPTLYLLAEDTLQALEAKLDSGWFETFLRRLFLENPHRAMVVLVPSQTLGTEKLEAEAARIAAESAAWTEDRLVRLRQQQAELDRWQQTPDTAEQLATIPMLQLSDLSPTPAPLPMTVTERQGVTVLRHETGSSLVYLNLRFDASDLTAEELPCAALLCELLGKLPTQAHSAAELQLLIKQKIGKLRTAADVFRGGDPAHCRVTLTTSLVCLERQKDTAASLAAEILTGTLFRDRSLLQMILNQLAMQAQMQLVSWGNRYAVTRCSAYETAHGAARERLAGYAYVNWLKDRSTDSDDALDRLLESLSAMARKLFTRKRLTLGASANAEDALLARLLEAIPQTGSAPGGEAAYASLAPGGEKLAIPAGVGFAAKAANLRKQGRSFCGSLYALSNILSYSYLWNEVRVQGGAYGTGFLVRDDGDLLFYSYRDPQPGRSVQVFDNAAQFIRDFCRDKPQLTKFILGAVADLDPLMNAEAKIHTAENRYFKGTSYEDVCRIYRQLLDTTWEELLELCQALDGLAAGTSACILAGQAQLDAAEI